MVLRKSLFFLIPFAVLSCESAPAVKEDGSPDAERLYSIHCVSCHKADGTGGIAGAANLQTSKLNMSEVAEVIAKGRESMMPFESMLSENEIAALSTYVLELRYK
jgi:mono/diheme cytochrome c family protein